MTSIPCDIAILPANALAQKATSLSGQLASHNTLFTLEDGKCYPHASLYMIQLKISDLDKAKTILACIANYTPQLELAATRYDQAEGYIDVEYARAKAIDRLQIAVIDALNPIRDGMREKDKARMPNSIGTARENLEKYGYRAVGELFRPHMTFTRFADGQPTDAAALPGHADFSGTFVKLGLFELGDNGTCVRRIAEFNLGRGGTHGQ